MRPVRGLLCALTLVLLLASCGGGDGPPRPSGKLAIATGNPDGVYADYGAGYADLLQRELPGTVVRVLQTDGSVENLRMVDDRRADVGFTLADSAANAVTGRPPFKRDLPVVALAALYDNYVQLVVRADSPIKEVEDLRRRTVSVGAPRSGTAQIAKHILDAAELVPREDLEALKLDVQQSADALAEGRIDAFFWSGGLPTRAIRRVSTTTPIRLVDLGTVVGELTKTYGELYTETRVPARVYHSDSAVTTVSVPNYLVVRQDMPQSQAYWLTRLLFEGQPRLADAHPEVDQLDRRAAIDTYPLKLHPGAERWYRESHP